MGQNKKDIEKILKEKTSHEFPAELDKNFYRETKKLSSNQENSNPIIWKSTLAFSFVLALSIYTFNYNPNQTYQMERKKIIDQIEMIKELDRLEDDSWDLIFERYDSEGA